jgi:hypothetical protein
VKVLENLSGRSCLIKIFLPLGVVLIALLLNGGDRPGAWGASGERNPFALPAGVQRGGIEQKKEGAGPGPGELASAPVFRVTTILVSGRTKVAGINGVLRQKGDEVNGYRITEIDEKQVTLVRGKDKRVLKIDPEAGYSFKKINSNNQNMGFSK